MFKTICLLALIALAASQDTSAVVSAVASSPVVNSTVAEAVANPAAAVANASNAVSAAGVPADQIPKLSDITVGWGNRNVNLTPSATNNGEDWLGNYEYLNVERFSGDAGEGEWNLGWAVENGDQYALWDQNGEIVLVDWQNSVWNVVDHLGSDSVLGPQLSTGAQQVVDAAYNNTNVGTVNSQQVAGQASGLSGNLNNFLAQQGQSAQSTVGAVANSVASAQNTTVADAANTAASTAASNPVAAPIASAVGGQ